MTSMVFDLETTGLNDPVDIIQLSYLIFNDETGEIKQPGVLTYFIPSRTDISPDAFAVSGISEEFLYTYTKKTFQDYISTFKDILKDVDILIGHNITGFDLVVLQNYKDTELNAILRSKKVIDTMKNYLNVLHKITCNKDSSGWSRRFLKLSECYYTLLRNGYDREKIQEDFKKTFKLQTSAFHNAAFDTYVTYLVYLYARSVGNAKEIC